MNAYGVCGFPVYILRFYSFYFTVFILRFIRNSQNLGHKKSGYLGELPHFLFFGNASSRLKFVG
jgi:hypothetical protein